MSDADLADEFTTFSAEWLPGAYAKEAIRTIMDLARIDDVGRLAVRRRGGGA